MFDVTNGAALHWAGINATYAPDPVGGTVSLRFGPNAKLYNGADSSIGLEYVKQAYGTLRPGGKNGTFTLDVGKFDAPYGSEVADSQLNINYTRAALYGYVQPYFFTGVRLDWAPSPHFDLKVIATNGWNNTIDNNAGKSIGAQIMWKPVDALAIYLGYMTGPEQPDNQTISCPADTALDTKTGLCADAPGAPGGDGTFANGKVNERFRHFGDLIIDINPTSNFRILFNGSIFTDKVDDGQGGLRDIKAMGANLGLRYAPTDMFAAGIRGEVIADPDGFATGLGPDALLYNGTLTLSLMPSSNFSFMLDVRADGSDRDAYFKGADAMSRFQITSTLGMIATTN